MKERETVKFISSVIYILWNLFCFSLLLLFKRRRAINCIYLIENEFRCFAISINNFVINDVNIHKIFDRLYEFNFFLSIFMHIPEEEVKKERKEKVEEEKKNFLSKRINGIINIVEMLVFFQLCVLKFGWFKYGIFIGK